MRLKDNCCSVWCAAGLFERKNLEFDWLEENLK